MTTKGCVLCVDVDSELCGRLAIALARLNCGVQTAPSVVTAIEFLGRGAFAVVVADIRMEEIDARTRCERLLSVRPEVPLIVLTEQDAKEGAIAAFSAGAYAVLTKPIDDRFLSITVTRALELHRLRAEVRSLKRAFGDPTGALDGDSPAIKWVNDLILRAGATEAPVLIRGELGTGKHVVAYGLHAASPRKDGPFVALSCAAVPHDLLESELFGHARDPFTGGRSLRRGAFAEASGGTLFLDEIGEIHLDLQAKLLRALQKRTVRPLGTNTEVPFDVRVVTATQRDLENDVRERRFRQDLFYQINVVRIDVPPLRERGSDVLKVAAHFLEKACERSAKGPLGMTPQVAECLLAYDWPGNVYELENGIERAVALARFDHLTLEDLPEKIRTYRADRFVISTNAPDEIVSLDELERRYIVRVINLLGGNKARAAQVLEVDRRTLYRKLERYGGGPAARHAITGDA